MRIALYVNSALVDKKKETHFIICARYFDDKDITFVDQQSEYTC